MLADFQSLQEYSDVEWWQVPSDEAYTKILADEKALEPSLKFKPVTSKKFHRDEKRMVPPKSLSPVATTQRRLISTIGLKSAD